MGAYKNFMLNVEELVWDAMSKGFTDESSIYAYVFMHEERVSRDTVHGILERINSDYEQIEACA